jgi:hypothetical protein
LTIGLLQPDVFSMEADPPMNRSTLAAQMCFCGLPENWQANLKFAAFPWPIASGDNISAVQID